MKMKGSKQAVPQREDRRTQREERRKKREERDKHYEDERVQGGNGSITQWRDGTEKGRSLRGKREERRERREKSAARSEKRETITMKIRGPKETMVRSQNCGIVRKRVGPSQGVRKSL